MAVGVRERGREQLSTDDALCLLMAVGVQEHGGERPQH